MFAIALQNKIRKSSKTIIRQRPKINQDWNFYLFERCWWSAEPRLIYVCCLINATAMKTKGLVANAQTSIEASVDKVWDALINPEIIKKYMFGTTVSSDWKNGSDITWTGEWKGKAYEDKGKIKQIKPKTLIQYTHYSPLTGEPDLPENYHTVTIKLTPENGSTTVVLSQDNNKTEDARQHSENNWTMMLSELKKLLESK
jgi:uncharacterized protein YndB with AHSA1/START domain